LAWQYTETRLPNNAALIILIYHLYKKYPSTIRLTSTLNYYLAT